MALRIVLIYVALRLVGVLGMPATSSAVSVICLIFYAWFVNNKLDIRGWDRWQFQLAGMIP